MWVNMIIYVGIKIIQKSEANPNYTQYRLLVKALSLSYYFINKIFIYE